MIDARLEKNRSKANARRVARDLGYTRYMPNIIERIESAETESQVTEILHECRRRWCEVEYAAL